MDLEIEKYVKKQTQLQEQIEKLFAEKKILQDQICVLNECLSLEKVNRKISELENKQKILTSLESMVNNLRIDIKPLEYLKQVLQRQLMVSSLPNNDLNIEERKYSESSICAIETLDSLSDDNSEESIMVLSDYDVISDEDDFQNAEKPVENKVMYDEALQMASSVYLTLVEHPIPNIDSTEPLMSDSNQLKNIECLIQSNSTNPVSLMNTSNESEQLLDLYDVVDKQDLLNCNENDKRKTEQTLNNKAQHQPCNYYKRFGDTGIKTLGKNECDNISKSANDSWIKISPNESYEISNGQHEDIFQSIPYLQKDNTVSKANIDVDEDICDHEIKSFENSCNNVDLKNDNVIQIPPHLVNDEVNDNSISSTDSSNLPQVLNEFKKNVNIVQVQNYHHQFESNDISEIKSFEKTCHDNDHSYESEIHNQVFPNNVLKHEVEIISSLSSNTEDSNVSNKSIKQKVNAELESQKINNQLCKEKLNFKYISEVKSFKNFCNDNNITTVDNDCCYENKIQNSICPNNVMKTTSSLLNTECSNVPRTFNYLFTNINDKLSSINNNVKPSCCAVGLKDELFNGIYHHGIQDLMSLQQQCMPHFINGHDVILHSYPCIGKSTACLISVLQRINTGLNECQAIVLVPTLELALSAQKTVKSIGKFLNVSTCIGGTNVPRKLSPVPHVVISTLQGLCEMINCNSLCKDFIKMFVIDDAEEMFKCNGFFNNIRNILLFLNNNRQLIILATSKIDEILDEFYDLMQNPEYIIVPDVKPLLNDILQYCVYVTEEWKIDAFYELYEALNLKDTVVYCNTWSKSLETAESMCLRTCLVSAVHNEMDTHQRGLILNQFQTGTKRVLVTTNLQRGEDFSDVSWVINYDLPKSPKDYVRKIVSCFGRKVKVINFVTSNDKTSKENIETAFNVNMLNIPQDLTDLCKSNLLSINQPIFN